MNNMPTIFRTLSPAPVVIAVLAMFWGFDSSADTLAAEGWEQPVHQVVSRHVEHANDKGLAPASEGSQWRIATMPDRPLAASEVASATDVVASQRLRWLNVSDLSENPRMPKKLVPAVYVISGEVVTGELQIDQAAAGAGSNSPSKSEASGTTFSF